MTRTSLYRHFDADGRLLYVGISGSHLIRLAEHIQKAGWADEIATITVERFASRETARLAEQAAIRDEQPLHNIVRKIVIHQALPDRAAASSAELIQEVDSWAAERGLSPATIVSRAVSNGRLYGRLKSGYGCTLKTATRIRTFIADDRAAQSNGRGRQ